MAWRQAGVFTRRQAIEGGATAGQVRWRVERRVWVPVAGSVLRAAAQPPSDHADMFAAHLTWPGCVVALATAARVHRLPVAADERIHVVVPSGRPARGRLTPHQFRLDDDDVVDIMGVHVTGFRRTVFDCLGRLAELPALDLLAWVASRHLVEHDELSSWVAEHPGRWGNPSRRRLARRLAQGAMNPAEDLLHAILRRGGVTGWSAGEPLHEHIGVWAVADVYFADVRLVIEVDGRRAHGDERFQDDRTRQNLLVTAGCTVLRYTWADLTQRPDEVAAQIRAALASLRAAPFEAGTSLKNLL
jgi:very-short-patch-repair endonuclease